MKRKKEPIFGPEEEERFRRTDELLRSRIEYHRAKLIEERPGWDAPKSDAEWLAYHDERIRQRFAE